MRSGRTSGRHASCTRRGGGRRGYRHTLGAGAAKVLSDAQGGDQGRRGGGLREEGGGEKQLVAIARALATNPSLIVLDEPTSALDVSIQAKIIGVLTRLKDRLNLSYMFITHNLSLMRNVADRVMIMYLGKVREVAPTEEFFKNPIHPYTKMLLSSIPVVSDAEEAVKPEKIVSTGAIAGALNLPPGCSFHPRCAFVMEVCKSVDPPLLEVEPEHFCNCHLYPNDYKDKKAPWQ